MKISANEMLLINKNLKFKGDEPSTASTATAVTEVPQSEDKISALNAQSMSNIAFQGVNIAGLKKAGLSSMTALIILAGSGLTSCQQDEPEYPKGTTIIYDNTQVITNITVNVDMTDEELVNAVLEELKALREQNKEQTAVNKSILEQLLKQGISLDRIISLLDQMNMTAQDIFNLLQDNSEKLDIFIDEMSEGNEDFKKQLTQILNAINSGNKLSVANNQLLTSILVQISKADKNDKAVIALLNKILTKVNESIQTDREIAAKQQMFMQAILGKLSAMDAHMKEGILAVIDKIDTVSESNIEILTAILTQLDENGKTDEKSLEIINAIYDKVQESIDTNKELNAETQNLMKHILGKLSEMDDHLKQGVMAILGHIDHASEANINLLIRLIQKVDHMQTTEQNTNRILYAVLAKIQESIDANKDMDMRTQQLLQSILDNIQNFNGDLKTAVEALLAKMDQIQAEDKILLGDILNNVQNFNGDMKTGFAAVITKLDGMSAENKALLGDILNNIQNFNEDMKTGFASVLTKLDSMSEEDRILLGDILNNIQNFNADLKTGVASVLTKLDGMSKENKILLGDILNNVQNFNEDMKTGFAVVITNQDRMSAQNRFFYSRILDRLNKMDDNAKMGLAMLIKQMATSNTLSQMQLNKLQQIMDKLETAHQDDLKFHNQSIALFSELLSKIDKLGGKADSILDAIGNLSLDANVDLSTIEKMLGDLLNQSKANGDILTSIESKKNLVALTLEGIKTQLEVNEADNKAILRKLDEILAKIPEKCNCNASLQVIIEKLDNIIDKINKGNNHEGILDDLDDMFN